MKTDYQQKKNVVSYIKYNFVFCSRYRRKIFNIPGVEKRFLELLYNSCNDREIEPGLIVCDEDHVCLSIYSNPQLAPSEIMSHIKSTTSSIIRQEFTELSKMSNLWTRAYLVSTEDELDPMQIRRFITSQKKRA